VRETNLASEYSTCFPVPFQVANLEDFPGSFADLPIRSVASNPDTAQDQALELGSLSVKDICPIPFFRVSTKRSFG
jgi:hypothetical protein